MSISIEIPFSLILYFNLFFFKQQIKISKTKIRATTLDVDSFDRRETFRMSHSTVRYCTVMFFCTHTRTRNRKLKSSTILFCYFILNKQYLCFWCTICIWHPFYGISMRLNTHDWNTSYFSDSSLQVLVTCCYNIAFVLCDSLHYAVIRICSFVHTW